jgi:hypothetical protein
MKLVILGAGASFDSVYEFFDGVRNMPWRPPLANELFDTRVDFRNIIQNYPGGRYYIARLNAIQDIEDFFQQQWLFLKNNRATDLSALFLNLNYCLSDLMFRISQNYKNVGLSNYDILIQKAYEYSINKKEDVIFVSFNYDTLLEQSFSKLYFGDDRKLEISDYIKFPIKIIKPHGSCNWVKKFALNSNWYKDQFIGNTLFENKFSLREINNNLEEEFFTIDNPASGLYLGQINERWHCFPQILIPLKDKDDFVLPRSHIDVLESQISNVNEILIIGWKGTEAKFQHLLQENIGKKKIHITSINAGFTDIEASMLRSLPLAEFYHYKEPSRIIKSDNRKVMELAEENGRSINHNEGTFSSYTINTQRGLMQDFFKL